MKERMVVENGDHGSVRHHEGRLVRGGVDGYVTKGTKGGATKKEMIKIRDLKFNVQVKKRIFSIRRGMQLL